MADPSPKPVTKESVARRARRAANRLWTGRRLSLPWLRAPSKLFDWDRWAGDAGEEAMRAAFVASMIGAALLASSASADDYGVKGNDTGGIIPWSCPSEA